MDILKALDQMERLTAKLSELYTHLYSSFSGYRATAGVFFKLSIDEDARHNLIQYQRRVIRKNRHLFGDVDVDLDCMKDTISRIEEFMGSHVGSLEEAMRVAMFVGGLSVDCYYRATIMQSDSVSAGVLRAICGSVAEISASLNELAASRNRLRPEEAEMIKTLASHA